MNKKKLIVAGVCAAMLVAGTVVTVKIIQEKKKDLFLITEVKNN